MGFVDEEDGAYGGDDPGAGAEVGGKGDYVRCLVSG